MNFQAIVTEEAADRIREVVAAAGTYRSTKTSAPDDSDRLRRRDRRSDIWTTSHTGTAIAADTVLAAIVAVLADPGHGRVTMTRTDSSRAPCLRVSAPWRFQEAEAL